MKRRRLPLIFGFIVLTFAGCANPAAVVKNETNDFKNRFPDHVMKTISGGRTLQYVWSGDPTKRPLVFVHGSPGSWEAWSHFLMDPTLREEFHIIAVDRPGFGGSNPGETERSLEKQAALIEDVLKTNKSGLGAILVGHSFGGPVIAKMAMSYPKQIAGVVFVASSVDPELESTKWYQYPADWWLIRSIIPTPLRVCNQEIFALKDQLELMLPAWKTFSAKVVTIQGESDDLVPPGNQDFLLRVLDPKLILKIDRVEGLNHFVPWKRPDLIIDAISVLDSALKSDLKKETR